MFDKQVQVRMGQASVRRWVDDILPLLGDDDPLGGRLVRDPPAAPRGGAGAYAMFQQKRDGAVKIVFRPAA